SALNVVSQMGSQGPDVFQGYKLNLVPWVTHLFENTFGPRLTPQIWKSPEAQMPVPVAEENLLLSEGFEAPIHPQDDDAAHIQGHRQAMMEMQLSGNNKNQKKFQVHIWQHIQQAQKKQQAAMMAQNPQMMAAMQQGQQGPQKPGNGARPGAMNKAPRGGQN